MAEPAIKALMFSAVVFNISSWASLEKKAICGVMITFGRFIKT